MSMQENETSGVVYARHRAESYRSGSGVLALGGALLVVLVLSLAYLVAIAAGARLWPL